MKTASIKLMKNEKGFTLIEVIAVLIILGILAAVAVPRYFDLSEEAKKKAFESAVSQAKSVCSLAYSKAALDIGGEPDVDQVIDRIKASSAFTSIEGDFVYAAPEKGATQKEGKDTIVIKVNGKPDTPFYLGDNTWWTINDDYPYWVMP